MSGEQVNEASLISGSSGPVTISHSNITIVAGESSRDEKRKESSTRPTDRLQDDGGLSQQLESLELDEKDITWLQPKKLFFFHKKPINKSSNVYYGKQVLADCCRDVAVKLIKHSDRAKKEINFLMKARHPNIVQIYDAGEYNSMGHWIYIVMELCTKTLRQYVEGLGSKPLDMETFVSIFNQLLNGLVYLHDNRILHRDIKPDNILVTESGEMKFSDFGISKQIESDRAEVTQTKYGAGSDGYRPPESYLENAKLTTAADIFSLALVMIHLISNGRHPFGSNPYDWRDNIRNNRNLDLSIIPQHIPPSKRAQLIDLAADMLKPEPRERPSVKQIKSHDFFKDASSTRVKDDEAAKSSNRKQMDAEANEKILDRKENSKELLHDSTQLSEMEDFKKILRLAERQLAEGNGDSAIERVQDFLSKESRSTMDVKNMADDLREKGRYVQAMILYKISHDLHKKEGRFSPDDELEWIVSRGSNIFLAITRLIEVGKTSRMSALKIGVKFLKQFLEEIREVKNANPDWRAYVESRCLYLITYVHLRADEFEESIRFCEEGLSIMMQQFGEHASNYRLYAILSHNLGVAYRNLGRYSEAESCYITAIEAYSKASDYENEKEREDDIALSERNLEKTRRMIANQK